MIQRLIILGGGGSAYDILDIVEAINATSPQWHIEGFLDDARQAGATHLGYPVLGKLTDAGNFTDCKFINAIGTDRNYYRREEIIASTGLPLESFATLVHPLACVSRFATLGAGVYVSHGASVGGAVVIGNHVSVSPGAMIGHDSRIGDYSAIAPGACISGFVTVEKSTYVGSRAVIRQHQQIGSRALIGMGAVVVNDVEPASVVIGNPARPLVRSETISSTASQLSRVDVIVPCYKYGHFLENCVNSALTQNGVDVRVLILDDASPDNTEQVGRDLARRDRRIEYRRHAINRGHIATYNEGLEWAAGKYLVLLSADDLLIDGALGRAARLMDQHPEVSLTYGNAIKTAYPENEPAPAVQNDAAKIMSGRDFVFKVCKSGYNAVPTPTAIVRNSIQKQVGGYRRELTHTGDMEMWLRFAAFGSVAVFDAYQAYYRVHGLNMSLGYTDTRELLQRQAAFACLWKAFGSRFENVDQLISTAARTLGMEAFYAADVAFNAGDLRAADDNLAASLQIDPALAEMQQFKRLKLKRRLGPRTWSTLRSLGSIFRGVSLFSQAVNTVR